MAQENVRWAEGPANRAPWRGERGSQGQPNGRILDQYYTDGPMDAHEAVDFGLPLPSGHGELHDRPT